MKNRSRTDIAAAILEAAQEGGAIKTHLMYSAVISYTQVKEYLDILIGGGLLESSRDGIRHTYAITDKGKSFLKMYREIDAILPKENMLTRIS